MSDSIPARKTAAKTSKSAASAQKAAAVKTAVDEKAAVTKAAVKSAAVKKAAPVAKAAKAAPAKAAKSAPVKAAKAATATATAKAAEAAKAAPEVPKTSGRKRAAVARGVNKAAAAVGDVVAETSSDVAEAATDVARGARKRAASAGRKGAEAVKSLVDSDAMELDEDNMLVYAPQRLSGFDFATWRAAINEPAMRSPIVGLVILEQSPDWERLCDRMDRASREAVILRQRVLEGPSEMLNPRLVIDPDFDLTFHMRRFRIAEPGDWDQVLDEVRRQSMTEFDLHRPLWRATLLEGLKGGRAALIVKLHHAIADGQGAMLLAASTIDLFPEGSELGPMPPAPVGNSIDSSSFVAHAVKDTAGIVVRAAKEIVDTAVPLAGKAFTDPSGAVEDVMNVLKSVAKFIELPKSPMSTVMTGRSINYHVVTYDVPLDKLKAAAKRHGFSLNDAFMAGVTGGLRRYHEARNEPVDRLRCNMPISLRDPDRPAANAVTIARFEVPVGETDPVKRMAEIHDIVAGWREEPALHLADSLAEFTRVVPTDMIAAAARTSDFTASNVPGVPMAVYIAGAKVEHMYPLMATVGAATNITLLSYNGTAALGVSMDDVAIDDQPLFSQCLADGFAEVIGQSVEVGDPLKGL